MASHIRFSLTVIGTIVLCGIAALPSRGNAQTPEFRGTVRDSASAAPIAGAVVMGLNAAGEMVARTISRENGTYRMIWAPSVATLRVLRLGFRPATVNPAPLQDTQSILEVTLVSLPRAMDVMEVVTAQGCPAQSDHGEAFGLLDQARAGLLSMVVARELQTPQLHVLRFDRQLDLDGIEIEQQTVVVDSTTTATTAFNAVHNALDFVEQGFRTEANGYYTFFAPDENVLLDTRFQRGYCFRVADRDPARPQHIGLRFSPANHQSKRVDIDGVVWIDTTANVLSEIAFRYVGVEPLAEAFGAGGEMTFKTLPNGVTFIDRWRLRLVGAPNPEVTGGQRTVQRYAIREVGGELAEARWPDGERWQAPLTSLQLNVVTRKGRPAEGASVALIGTNYRAIADVNGRAIIPNVLPGQYGVLVGEPRLQPIRLDLPANKTVTARRASTVIARVVMPVAEAYLGILCRSVDPDNEGIRVLGRAMTPNGQSAGSVNWRLNAINGAKVRTLSKPQTTPSSGIVHTCDSLELGSIVELSVWRGTDSAVSVRRVLVDSLTVIPIFLPVRPPPRSEPPDPSLRAPAS